MREIKYKERRLWKFKKWEKGERIYKKEGRENSGKGRWDWRRKGSGCRNED